MFRTKLHRATVKTELRYKLLFSALYIIIFSISNQPSPDEKSLASMVQIAKEKTGALKKGLAKQKNLLAAKKKQLISKQLQPSEDLTKFLKSDTTFEEILKIAHRDAQDMAVQRYG